MMRLLEVGAGVAVIVARILPQVEELIAHLREVR